MSAQTQVTPPTDSSVAIGELSLAEYRAHREKPVEAPPIADTPEPAAEEESTLGGDAGGSDAAEDTADDQELNTGERAEQQPRKKGGWQRKIEKAEREIESLKAQLAAKPAAETAQPSKDEPAPAPEGPQFERAKPRLEDFDSIESFTDALTDFKADERDWRKEQAAAQAKAAAAGQKLVENWNAGKAEAQKAHSDYDDVLADADDVKLTPAHQRIFLKSEHGPELAYRLALDRAELEKFAAMDPLEAAHYLGRLEATLPQKTAPQPETRVSSAPRPVRPVAGRSTQVIPDVGKMSLSEYRRAREAGKIA
jgi:hypothetical protein